VLGAADILELQKLIRRVPVADTVVRYAVRLARATRGARALPSSSSSGCRGARARVLQYLVLGAKTRAGDDGRYAPGRGRQGGRARRAAAPHRHELHRPKPRV